MNENNELTQHAITEILSKESRTLFNHRMRDPEQKTLQIHMRNVVLSAKMGTLYHYYIIYPLPSTKIQKVAGIAFMPGKIFKFLPFIQRPRHI